MLDAVEIEDWLQRARDTGTRIDMAVSCSKCWLPVPIDGPTVPGHGCQCGTVVTIAELKAAFGIEGMSGSFHDVMTVD
ncbi:hypothetical protein LCGC14_0942250 [marine sediment metagenome]|uniref:Uncharacterized protein n=1 Tax=marine sediment metagenome TaxID=412755 RepID=A0A0F9R3F4_9ZZZZ